MTQPKPAKLNVLIFLIGLIGLSVLIIIIIQNNCMGGLVSVFHTEPLAHYL